jgi:hypothetical protein
MVPSPPQIAAPMKFIRGPNFHSQAPRNEPAVTMQSRIK